MIRFGPAGIPLSCKGRTLRDGIEDVHNLGLSALEIQMVRAGTSIRPPDDEEVGLCLNELTEGFVIEIMREDEIINDVNTPIEEDDGLVYMLSGVTNYFSELNEIGDMAKRLDVDVSLHTPYYMDLGSNDELTLNCVDSIRHAGLIVDALNGPIVVTNLGLYTGLIPNEEIDSNIEENLEDLMGWWKDNKLKPKLGIEITGHQGVFGSLEQVQDICHHVKGVVPVVNFPHFHSRTDGSLREMDDYLDLLEAVEPYCKGHIHMEFAGVEYLDREEKRLTPIKKGDLKFEVLAEALCEMKPDGTVISCSPLLEHDAMYMKVINERILNKRVAKAMKEKRKAEAAATLAEGAEPSEE